MLSLFHDIQAERFMSSLVQRDVYTMSYHYHIRAKLYKQFTIISECLCMHFYNVSLIDATQRRA